MVILLLCSCFASVFREAVQYLISLLVASGLIIIVPVGTASKRTRPAPIMYDTVPLSQDFRCTTTTAVVSDGVSIHTRTGVANSIHETWMMFYAR